jgi:hypothetical protein
MDLGGVIDTWVIKITTDNLARGFYVWGFGGCCPDSALSTRILTDPGLDPCRYLLVLVY